MTFSATQIAALISGQIEGNSAAAVNGFGRIEDAQPGQLSFLANPRYEDYIYQTEASIVIISDILELKQPVTPTLIRVNDPYSAFATLLNHYQQLKTQQLQGLQQPNFIATSAIYGKNVYIGAFAYVGDGTKIGDNVKIFPGVYIGNNVQIGDNSLLHPGVKIYFDCVIGKNVTIHAGTVIGGDGFGFAPQPDGSFNKVPQIGNVIIEDNVEIESLQSQKIFLENKGYEVHTLTNGADAVDYLKENLVDVVLMDESMPGLTGLQTLARIKEINSQIPVVLITKNETENLMDDAIGNEISDYLIKPVNPNQVWLSLKKIIDNKRLVAEKTTSAYQQEFRHLFTALNSNPDFNEWMDVYKKLVYWELEMEKSDSPEMQEILHSQKQEANTEFFKFISRNYLKWMDPRNDAPIMSNTLMQYKAVSYTHLTLPTT